MVLSFLLGYPCSPEKVPENRGFSEYLRLAAEMRRGGSHVPTFVCCLCVLGRGDRGHSTLLDKGSGDPVLLGTEQGRRVRAVVEAAKDRRWR